jgi:hypothetical protein
MKTETEALTHYHTHYNNLTYQAVQRAVVADLTTAYQAHEPALLAIALIAGFNQQNEDENE